MQLIICSVQMHRCYCQIASSMQVVLRLTLCHSAGMQSRPSLISRPSPHVHFVGEAMSACQPTAANLALKHLRPSWKSSCGMYALAGSSTYQVLCGIHVKERWTTTVQIAGAIHGIQDIWSWWLAAFMTQASKGWDAGGDTWTCSRTLQLH